MSIRDELAASRVGVCVKRRTFLFVIIAAFLRVLGVNFWTWWTTIGPRTIWAPVGTDLSSIEAYATVIRHELVHARQARRWPVFWQLSYLLLPLPFGLAWCRWASERQAYLVQLRAGTMTIDEVVTTLWDNYGWCYPRSWMRAWLARAVLS